MIAEIIVTPATPLIRYLGRCLCFQAGGSVGRACTEATCLRKAGCHCPLSWSREFGTALPSPAGGGMGHLAAPLEPSPLLVVILHIRYLFLGMKGFSLFLLELLRWIAEDVWVQVKDAAASF